jgi:dTDP-4-dehydrorhamnose 3,5-epimerase
VISGVRIVPLRKFQDERGELYRMLRSDDEHFQGFGEIYFSSVKPGAVKAWHLQRRMIRHYAAPVGTAKVVLYDDRAESPTLGKVQEIVLGEANYQLLIIPPNIWSGFTAIGNGNALIADCTTAPHDQLNGVRKDPWDPSIPYRWDLGAT